MGTILHAILNILKKLHKYIITLYNLKKICLFLVSLDEMSPFLLFAVLSVITAMLDVTLPFDTLGRDLDIWKSFKKNQYKDTIKALKN